MKQVDIYYLHAPDHSIPFEETLDGINKLYQQGSFKRFGLSNFHAEDVHKVYDICEKNGWVKPTAYQGNYNAVARKQETVLFPTLRKLGMCFYAYSPLAGVSQYLHMDMCDTFVVICMTDWHCRAS